MSKSLSNYKALKDFVKANSCFEINMNELFCNVCNKKIIYNSKEGVRTLKRHILAESHVSSEKIKLRQSRLQGDILEKNISSDLFHEELLNTLVKANIPLNKIDNLHFKQFLEKWTGVRIKTEGYCRKTLLDKIYTSQRNVILEKLKEAPIFFYF